MTFYADHTIAAVDNYGQSSMPDYNKGITPVFFVEDVEDPVATEEAGTLRLRQEERVKILTAGDQYSCPVHPVTEDIKRRFADAYRQWKATAQDDYVNGLPLSQWPLASKGFALELRALNLRSVEDLSVASEHTVAKILDGRAWREKAIAWLDANKGAGEAAKYAAAAARAQEEAEQLREQMKDLQNEFRAFMAKAKADVEEAGKAEPEEDAPRRRGRPPNS
jgi:hypothetical protein